MSGELKVLVCGLRGFPNVQGGVETHCENLYTRLANMGCEISIAVRPEYHQHAAPDYKGVSFVKIWAPKSTSLEAIVHSLLVVAYAVKVRPDILHIHAIGPAIVTPIARLFGLQVVVTHHGMDFDREKWNAFAKAVLRVGESMGMRYANARVVISKTIKNWVETTYKSDTVLIPNGVNLPEIAAPGAMCSRYQLSAGKYVVCISRVVPEKRQLDLMHAFLEASTAEGWRLVVVGNDDHAGDYEKSVLAFAEEHEDIICVGKKSGSDLAELFSCAGLFVLPSSHEGLPIALLEALSYGLECIASDIPANLEVELGDEHYFPLGDCSALAEKISQFTRTIDGRAAANREFGRQLVAEKYDWAKISEDVNRVYSALR